MERRPFIPAEKLDEIGPYLSGLARNLGFKLIVANGTRDHLHALVAIPTTMRVSEIAQKIKANTSRWLGRDFQWQEGYGAFSVSSSQVEGVRRYIAGQQEHHRKRTFDEGFRSFLAKCGMPSTETDS